MKNAKNTSTIFYIIAVLFYVAAIITFGTGNHNSTGVILLCLGSMFLSIGTTKRRRESSKDDTNKAQ